MEEQKAEYKKIGINTFMLYLLTVAKIVFPLITLPYLTRVLSVDCYGVVAYVKSVITYVQLTINFGFIYSSVRDITNCNKEKSAINEIVGSTIVAKLILSAIVFVVLIIMSYAIPILRGYKLYLILSFLTPFLSCFLLDFLFRGIEKMHIVSLVYVSMKTISTLLVIVFVKNDSQLLLMPVFDAIGSLLAIAITWIWAHKLGFSAKFIGIKDALKKIKGSVFYFTNSIASSAFGALTTIIIGLFIIDTEQVAYWSVCMQLIAAVQSLYTPISNGIYPHMVKTKDLKLIKKVLIIFMPIVVLGTVFCFFFSPTIITIISGSKYINATNIFRILLPVLIISFPVAILALPALGAISKVKQINLATLLGAVTQILGLILFAALDIFTVVNVAIIRNISEFVMFVTLVFFIYKYRKQFNQNKKDKN